MAIQLKLILLMLFSLPAVAQNQATATLSPEAVVRAYTDAANRHDLEGFLAFYSPSIRKFRFPGEFASQGIEHYRAVYAKSFSAAPNLKIEIVTMIVLNDKVIVRDRVTGRPDGKVADELTVYQVQEGRITNIEYIEQHVG